MAEPTPAAPDVLAGLLNDPIVQQMMADATGGSSQPESLEEALVGSVFEVTGRQGLTGSPLSVSVPEWAKDLAPAVLGHPDFDPYLGIVSQSGDERVFWKEKEIAPVELDSGAPLAEGMARPGKAGTDADENAFGEFYGDLADKAGVKVEKPEQVSSGDEFRSGGQRPADEVQTPGEDKSKTTKGRQTDKTYSATQVMNMPYTWDNEEIADAIKRMRQAGIPVDSFDMGSNSLVSIWGALVNRAAMTYSLSEGERKVTPWDVLDMYKSEAKAAGTFQDLNRSETTVQRSVSEITEGEAWMTLRDNLSRMLGRDPSDQEVRDFTFKMNQLAAQNPSISKTITQYKNGEAVSATTKTSGGFTGADVAEEAYEDAQGDPEYAEYQSATTYFNAAMSALGAIGQT